jgi:hypothetical protein
MPGRAAEHLVRHAWRPDRCSASLRFRYVNDVRFRRIVPVVLLVSGLMLLA